MLRQILLVLSSATIASVTPHFAAVANPRPTVFCSIHAEAILGDACVDSQGNVPDNADIRSVIVGNCRLGSQVVAANARGTVRVSFDRKWAEYQFCSQEPTSNNHSIYYFRINYDNSVVYRYSTQDESWGRLDIFSYSVQSGELNGRMTVLLQKVSEVKASFPISPELRSNSEDLIDE